ncbi:MAG TPA: alpha/beta hydrolase [Pseudolabrys sp.]|nr:alpha/beta hydrolase [Pseudolabrys sp.]
MPVLLRNTVVVLIVLAVMLAGLFLFTRLGVQTIEAEHPPAGRFVDVERGRMHVVELGNRAAPAVVLLHGSSINLADMRMALGDRLERQYHVVLVDRPGHGWSDRPDGAADASPARQAAILRETLSRIGVGRAILVAHSWAGALALAYALAYPEQTAGLVLLAPLTHPSSATSAWHDNFVHFLLDYSMQIARSPVLGPLMTRTVILPIGRLTLGLAVRTAFAPQSPPADYIAKSGAELLLRPSEFIANAEDVSDVQDALKSQAPRYATINVPTTIITGTDDAVLSPDVNAKALARVLPDAKLIVLPGVGHMVHFAAPEQVVGAIADIAREPGQAAADAARQAR